MKRLSASLPISFPRDPGENTIQAGDLALQLSVSICLDSCITVAGQHRTSTGFAFMPSHPGERHLNSNIFNYFMPCEL